MEFKGLFFKAFIKVVNKDRAHEEWRLDNISLFLRDCDMREEGREEQRSFVVMNMLKRIFL